MSNVQSFLSRMLTAGGDRRIAIAPGADANRYGATPFPRAVSAYASSTANDISADAFAHLSDVVGSLPAGPMTGGNYAQALQLMRVRLRDVLGLGSDTGIVFAPSGTDLEFVALAMAQGRSRRPISNVLLGADEVGSGCALAAGGRYFAAETAIEPRVRKGAFAQGFETTLVEDIAVRCGAGLPCASATIAERIDSAIAAARGAGRHALVHIIHGSKTGLVLPSLDHVDALLQKHGEAFTLVVDACQARLEPCAIRAYLDRGAIVLLTGSKFIGGPPFSGFALLPTALPRPVRLPPGFASLFRRGEWPTGWEAAERLQATANPGLLLRIEAALFELERFHALPIVRRQRVIAAFGAAVERLPELIGVRLIGGPPAALTLERSTLATLGLTPLPGSPDFATAQRLQRVLAARGMRVGQPVKCLPLPNGGWGGTLRLGLSMPLIMALDELGDGALIARLTRDMDRIADILLSATRPMAA